MARVQEAPVRIKWWHLAVAGVIGYFVVLLFVASKP